MTKKRFVSLVLSVLLTAGLLVLLLRSVSSKEIVEALGSVPVKIVVLGFLCHAAAYFFRTWAMLLFFRGSRVGYGYLLRIHFLHNFYVHVVPASLGELSFPILTKDRLKVEKSLSVLLISRLLIMGVTLLLFLVSLFLIFGSHIIQFRLGSGYYLIGGIVLIFTALICLRKPLFNLLQRIGPIAKIATKVRAVLLQVRDELTKFRDVGFTLKATGLSALSILCIAFFYLLVLNSLGHSLHLLEIVFVSSIGMAFIILPVKSLGGFGTTEGAWTIGLLLLGLTKENSIEAGFVIHLLSLVNVLFLFAVGMLMRMASRLKRKQRINPLHPPCENPL